MDLATARKRASIIQHSLTPACHVVEVAGSIRRWRPAVKDIELVAVPITEPIYNLFGDQIGLVSLLDSQIQRLIEAGFWEYDADTKRNGPAYKRLKFEGQAVDLFIAAPENYGNILTIRTGSAEFSHLLVTSRLQGGCMPAGMRQQDGYLWTGGRRINCPTEAAFFAALGIKEVPEPWERNADTARRLAAMAGREGVSEGRVPVWG